MELKKIAILIPYFGNFNNFFPIWLHSCKYNPTIDWFIFTDNQKKYDYPKNVKVYYTTFEETKKKLQSKFDFEIVFDKPYKICEFRPAFGEIYEEYLSGYDFWGYGDLDVIWGNLRRHITDEILSTYSKINCRGHLTLIKNDKRLAKIYRSEVNGIELYKYILTNEIGVLFPFDEHEITYIFEQKGEPIYRNLPFADLEIKSFNFRRWYYDEPEPYKNLNQIFYWEKGDLYRMFVHEGKLTTENFAYVHFLKRPMAISTPFDFEKNIWIVPNKFISNNNVPTLQDVLKFSAQRIYWSYIIERFTLRYLLWRINYTKNQKAFDSKFRRVHDQPTVVLHPHII